VAVRGLMGRGGDGEGERGRDHSMSSPSVTLPTNTTVVGGQARSYVQDARISSCLLVPRRLNFFDQLILR